MIFIAKSDLSTRADYFPRVKSKDLFDNKSIENVRFLHFESNLDMTFIRRFIEKNKPNKNQLNNIHKNIGYVFTPKKMDAIKEHRDALKMGLNVSSLVDMDSDIECKMIGKSKRIHSSKYACTILTIQFLKENMVLNYDHLYATIKQISGLSNKNRIDRIISNAIENTYDRLSSGNAKTRVLFDEHGLQNPINDHELATAIVVETKKQEYWTKKYEKKLRTHALEDSNGLLGNIVGEMIGELNA